MCGFVAAVDHRGQPVPSELVESMLQTITHRGPDDRGVWFDGSVGLGFRRLSILDLSPMGHQPMTSEDDQLTIVFNGEIFNFIELRDELRGRGHAFRSAGDTEVLLAAYREWGTDCLQKLNGMWSFVIHDRARRLLFGSRDRFGIKPLFRFTDGANTLFGSEIKALLASGLPSGRLNARTCAAFFAEDRLDDTDETFFDGVVQVPPGHAFELALGSGEFRQWSFWDVSAVQTRAHPDAPAEFAAVFEDAMRIHMRSDVPVGVNLSGGLDSTSILCAAARINAQQSSASPLLAFCYMDRQFDESRYIADTLQQTGAQLVPLQLTPEQLWDSLPQVLAAQDEPVHSMTAIVGYHLMQLAARHGVKVVLNGQGADELIGGYGSYFIDRWTDLMRSGHPVRAWQDITAYGAMQGGAALPRFAQAGQRALQQTLSRASAAYRAAAARRRLARARQQGWLAADLTRQLDGQPPTRRAPTLRDELVHSMTHSPLPLYLRVEDRNSMAHSVEARLPFLDKRLVELVMSMDSPWKVHGPWNKHVLREAMRGRIPESVRARVDKMGFPTNAREWFRGRLHSRLAEVLHDDGFDRDGFFDRAALRADLTAHREGRASHEPRLFAAAQFDLWRRQWR